MTWAGAAVPAAMFWFALGSDVKTSLLAGPGVLVRANLTGAGPEVEAETLYGPPATVLAVNVPEDA